ncbi:hypothetical protein OEZ60_10540 [Defluviimonas sp. WL0024]|uniref:DUF4136 domain-containing protein n=2 Tax=Albidovulum TaxID=205889 RepID=A0ABT3IYQ7_9RHOB|nr:MULTISPECIES: hypothetical protein [Defluviimonas]MCU9848447.1 hypothetical protein [Defluviimonas sp. WL0024]MCW3780568.1 hypothetical protein [Defluviimonas salinarum]
MRRFFAALSVLLLTACAAEDLSRPPEPLGDFAVGYTIVVAKNAQSVGPSRQATAREWEHVLKTALDKHFGRYDGDKLYHIGVTVDAYALAIPGVPVVLNPKSVLAINVNVWDDTAGRKINAEPEQLTVFQSLSGETVIGSGLTQNRKEQMEDLAANAADDINDWLLRNKAWFTPEAVAARAALAAAEGTAPKPPATTN